MKYSAQVTQVQVAVPDGKYDRKVADSLVGVFERDYERLFGAGSGYAAAGVMITSISVTARASLSDNTLLVTGGATIDGGEPPVMSERDVIWYERGLTRVTTPIYDGLSLRPGMTFQGPAIVELPSTTVVVRPGQSANTDALGNIEIALEENKA